MFFKTAHSEGKANHLNFTINYERLDSETKQTHHNFAFFGLPSAAVLDAFRLPDVEAQAADDEQAAADDDDAVEVDFFRPKGTLHLLT